MVVSFWKGCDWNVDSDLHESLEIKRLKMWFEFLTNNFGIPLKIFIKEELSQCEFY